MPATVVVGTQWGDEGKGKLTDVLAKRADYVVRYQGGHNAGHTIVVNDEKIALQLVPSGILYPHVIPVIANGVAVEPFTLIEELRSLELKGFDTSKLAICSSAHLILPYHLEIDKMTERYLGKNKLGTTKRGIGPTYADKAARIGLRVQDLLDEKIFSQKLEVLAKEKNAILAKVYNRLPIDPAEVADKFLGPIKDALKPFIKDTVTMLQNAYDEGKNILLEGAQATFLDVDHGTYPYVTSSNPTAGGACTGSGLGPKQINKVIGIAKAYITRVGAGPFPTELFGNLADHLVERGQEYGTNTGRQRRVGWLDTVMLRHAKRINSIDEIALTKVDVLDGLEKVKICVAYRSGGNVIDHVPDNQSLLHKVEPIYNELPGWESSASDNLPVELKSYIRAIEDIVATKISYVSLGPERNQLIEL